MRPYPYGSGYRRGGSGRGIRLVLGLAIALISVCSYLSTRTHNDITGKTQYVDLTPQQEISLGLQSLPGVLNQYGGDRVDPRLSSYVTQVGNRIVRNSAASKSPYQFAFHVLSDMETVNAFALPGGQVFITAGLMKHLSNEAELAAVLGHEIGHVVARHGAEHLAKAQLTSGIAAAYVVGSDNPNDPYDTQRHAAIAAAVAELVNLRYSRQDELEADGLGLKLMAQTGYDPRAMLDLMKVLEDISKGARTPEFFSTHPNPENRLSRIEEQLRDQPTVGGETAPDRYQKYALSILRGATR